MIFLKLHSGIFLLLLLFTLARPACVAAQQPAIREIATFGAWTAALNLKSRNQPYCQIQAVVKSPDPAYVGTLTVWNDQQTPQNSHDNIYIEVMVTAARSGDAVRLAITHDHQFGNDRGSFSGVVRSHQGELLFPLKKSEFRSLLGSSMKIFQVAARDEDGKDITLVTPLDGIAQACMQCGLFD